jgi:2-dehydro-3-deoxyglucarate aldolase/4-hydroxy-2-oxoheptanedioate aldolase
MIASCRGSDIVPMARVPDVNFAPLSRALDLGAKGVMVPRVETRQQAENIVSQLKYAPQGRRGVALGVAHDLYRAGDADFFAKANEEIVVILLLETEKAFENLDEIASVPGIDVAWMGHYDLTVSMGIPAQFEHPRLLAVMDALVACCRKYGVAPGFLPSTPESALHWIEQGFRAISLGSDIGVFLDGVRKFRAHVVQRAREHEVFSASLQCRHILGSRLGGLLDGELEPARGDESTHLPYSRRGSEHSDQHRPAAGSRDHQQGLAGFLRLPGGPDCSY